MTQGTITEPFHHKGIWYFPGDKVEGEIAKAAEKANSLRTKFVGSAPENKTTEKKNASTNQG